MFKTFAHVCILSSLALAAGHGHSQATAQPTTGTVKNHISDVERDRLMQQAMEKARLELEKTRAETEARERLQAERAAQAKREAAATKAAEEKKRADEAARKQADAAARKRAEEERLAAELAEAEKKSSEKTRQQAADAVKDLDAEKTERAKATPAPASSETKKTVTAKSESKPDPEPKTASKPASAEKVVVESIPTRGQSAPLTVKTTMPVGDEQRRAEQAAARRGEGSTARASDRPVASASSSSGSTHTYTGLIVGVMRSSSGEAKVLIQQEDGLTVQAVLANVSKIPAPGTLVSVRGKTVGGSEDSPVISAKSLDVKSGRSLSSRVPEVRPEPEPDLAPPPYLYPDPVMMGPGPIMGPPMPPLGPMGPMGGPMPMMGPMPPF